MRLEHLLSGDTVETTEFKKVRTPLLYAISLSLVIIAIFDILKAKANLSKVSDFIVR